MVVWVEGSGLERGSTCPSPNKLHETDTPLCCQFTEEYNRWYPRGLRSAKHQSIVIRPLNRIFLITPADSCKCLKRTKVFKKFRGRINFGFNCTASGLAETPWIDGTIGANRSKWWRFVVPKYLYLPLTLSWEEYGWRVIFYLLFLSFMRFLTSFKLISLFLVVVIIICVCFRHVLAIFDFWVWKLAL